MKADDATNAESSDTYIAFHNTVMRWKCSQLTEEELRDMDEWIANSLSEKKEERLKPWKAMQGEETEWSAENEYVQKCILPSPQIVMRRTDMIFRSINALPATLNTALEQIERSTGMKAIILIGGPVPSADGDINTHMYVLCFSTREILIIVQVRDREVANNRSFLFPVLGGIRGLS